MQVIHAEVKGRARLKVSGLYRCEPVRLRIESALVRGAGIRQVNANVLTGRVLVVFDPSRTAEEISVLVEGLLAAEPDGVGQNIAAKIHPLRPLQSAISASANAGPASGQDRTSWHALPGTAVATALATSKDRGLSQASAQRKLRRFGPNSLPESPPRSGLSIFLGQFKS
ncbi:MAG TPA: cation-transporting P-type ATPase, partial [Nitrosospira sp.]|nr:cation-transporting P-type ATPase [Nitrosospira sp.]